MCWLGRPRLFESCPREPDQTSRPEPRPPPGALRTRTIATPTNRNCLQRSAARVAASDSSRETRTVATSAAGPTLSISSHRHSTTKRRRRRAEWGSTPVLFHRRTQLQVLPSEHTQYKPRASLIPLQNSPKN